MKRYLHSLIFLGFHAITFGQVVTDSLVRRIESSVNVDSLNKIVSTHPHYLVAPYNKIDSIRKDFMLKADSLQGEYQTKFEGINSQVRKINQKIDSLQRLNISTNKYNRPLRKLTALREKTQKQFNEKVRALKSKTTDKLKALDLPAEYVEPVQRLTQQIEEINLDNPLFEIPELNSPVFDLPEVEGIGSPPSLDVVNGVDLPQISNVQTPGELGEISHPINDYQEKLKQIAQTDIKSVEKLPEALESHATKIDGVEELQKHSGAIDQHKGQFEKLRDPKAAEKKAVEMAKKAAVDRFGRKDGELKAAMEKISKYKKKYSSVSSIKDLPKRPPNAMKGKSLIERLIPGVYLQYQQRNSYLVDINPYVGYKLTGRFVMGFGWNHRLARDSKNKTWDQRSRINGPRAFVDFKLAKGFITHIEGESMNAFVPSAIHGSPDAGQREWIWSFMTGIKKEFKIHKNLRGTGLIQYNLFNRYYKAPYVDRLNARMGFEYVLVKKKRTVDRSQGR